MCIDFTTLNKFCPKDEFLLPRIDTLVDAAAWLEMLSMLDCFSGYHQIWIRKEYEEKTSFITPFGTYRFVKMPKGLNNVGRSFSRMSEVLGSQLLAVDFDDFYHQHSFGFHALGTILLWFLLTLTSSTSFGNYLNLGATSANLGQNGANPRPAGLGQAGRPAPITSGPETLWRVPWARGYVTQIWVLHNSWVKTERPGPRWVEATTCDNSKNQSPIQPEK